MTLRGVDWTAVVASSTIGAAILTGCATFSGHEPPFGYLRLALIALGAAGAFVLDDPAAAVVDSVPCTRRHRTAARATAAALPFLVWTVGVVAVDMRTTGAPVAALLSEGAGVLAVAVTLAAVLRQFGHTDPGEIVASVMGSALLAEIIFRPPPRSVPLFPVGDGWAVSTALWCSVTVAAVALVFLVSREPYRP